MVLLEAGGNDRSIIVESLRDVLQERVHFRWQFCRALELFFLLSDAVNLGSSIGISKVRDTESLETAMDLAAGYDIKMMVETSVEGARELECAVLGNEDPKASVIGEIIPGAEFYDYTTKYIDDHSQLIVPADLSDGTRAVIQEMSIDAFRSIDGAGLGRVDFLLAPSGQVFLNEINTMPGFTPISMYPRLWQASGVEYSALIDRLIELALDRHLSSAVFITT